MTYTIHYDRNARSYYIRRSDGEHMGWYVTKAEAAYIIATGQVES